jgi:hypothetical protein
MIFTRMAFFDEDTQSDLDSFYCVINDSEGTIIVSVVNTYDYIILTTITGLSAKNSSFL